MPSTASPCRSRHRSATRTPVSTCPRPGCYTFNGDHALAYARSRKLEYLDAERRVEAATPPPTSVASRASRTSCAAPCRRLLDKGAYNPDVAGGLIQTLSEYIVTDQDLTPTQDARVRRRAERRRPDGDHDVPDRGRPRERSRATPCWSQRSTATTCRRSSRCSAARRRSAPSPIRSSTPRAPTPPACRPTTVGAGDHRSHRSDGAADRHDAAAGARRREHLRHRPRQEHLLLTVAAGVRPRSCETASSTLRCRAPGRAPRPRRTARRPW